MTFLDWVTQQYPEQFIPEKQLTLLLEAWRTGQAAERERIKKIIDAVGWKVKHDAWLDCCDVILERIEDDSRSI